MPDRRERREHPSLNKEGTMNNARFVTLNGVRTRYFEAGTGDDLVLIHGGKFGTFYSAYHWSLNFHELSKHFHVYAFDKLGMGDTDNPKSDADYTRSEEHTSELQSQSNLVCRLLLEKKKKAIESLYN